MTLSDGSQQILCGMAVAGAAVASTVLGVNVATGLIELATGGGNLLLSVSREQQDRCDTLLRSVRKRIEKDYRSWAKAEFRDGHFPEAEFEEAMSALDTVLPAIKPTTHDVVDAGFNAEKLFLKMKGRLPERCVFRESRFAENVLKSVVLSSYTLIRTDDAFVGELTSFSFERLFTEFDGVHTKLDSLQRQGLETQLLIKRNHEELLAAQAKAAGVSRDHLRPLFEAVDKEVPESDFDTAIHEAVTALSARGRDPVALLNDPEEIRRAIEVARDKLASFDPDGAIAHLRKARQDQLNIRRERMRGEARLALEEAEILKIVYRWDEAVAAFETAAELDPDDARPWGEIGDIRISRGNLALALEAFRKAEAIAERTGSERALSVSYDRIGDVERARGNRDAALKAYSDSLDIAKKLAARDPANTKWQRDLSVSYDQIGDVETARGNRDAALKVYSDSLDIRKALTARDPANTEWQRDLSVSYNRIGDVERERGNRDMALKAYSDGLDIAKKLAARDPANTKWQRDLSVSYNQIGDVERARGNRDAALKVYSDSLDIRKALAARDPANTEWQRDLSVSYNKIGDVEVARGNGDAALKAYSDSLDIAKKLVARDPANTEWQRDLIVSNVKLAEMGSDPAKRYQAALTIARNLAETERLAPVDAWMISDLERRLSESAAQ